MTLTYLSLQQVGTVRANGTVNLTLRPDTGQYWLPTIVTVTTLGGTQIRCNLHAGGVAALTSPTTIKDLTYQGASDTSSVLSGLVINPGEGILCEFLLGTPNEVVFMTLTGMSSDTPPTIGAVPTVPGTRFLGASNIGLQSGLASSIQTAQSFVGGTNAQSATIDMRGYQSFTLTYDCTWLNAPANWVLVNIAMVWYDSASLTRVVYEDEFDLVPAANGGGAFDNPFNRLEVQDNVHGQFLVVYLFTSVNSLNPRFNMFIYGNSRPLPCQYIRNTQGKFGIGSNAQGEDATQLLAVTAPIVTGIQQFLLRYAPGPAVFTIINGTGAATTIEIITVDGVLEVFNMSNFAAGGTGTFKFVHPKKQCFLQINNGAPNNAILYAHRELTQTGG